MVFCYIISIIAFYILFFRTYFVTRNSYKSWDKEYIVDEHKLKMPIWVWVVAVLVLLSPIFNAVIYVTLLVVLIAQYWVDSDDLCRLSVKLPKFLSFLTRRY